MAFKNITISERAYHLLSDLKQPGDSFTKVIERHVRKPCANAGELIDQIWANPPPDVDEKLIDLVLKQRGRRSNRK